MQEMLKITGIRKSFSTLDVLKGVDLTVHKGEMCIRDSADAVPQLPERCLSRKAGIVRCCHNAQKGNAPDSQGAFPFYFLTSVSYTHLDVYKRQVEEIFRTAAQFDDGRAAKTYIPPFICAGVRWPGCITTCLLYTSIRTVFRVGYVLERGE